VIVAAKRFHDALYYRARLYMTKTADHRYVKVSSHFEPREVKIKTAAEPHGDRGLKKATKLLS